MSNYFHAFSSTDYEGTLTRLDTEINKMRRMRDSQPEGAETYEYYQDKATELAQYQITLEQMVPRLQKLDKAIAAAEKRTRREEVRQDSVRSQGRSVALTGGIGAGVSLLVIASGLAGLFPLLGQVLIWATLVGGLALTAHGIRRQLTVPDVDTEALQEELAQLRARRRGLLPSAPVSTEAEALTG